VVSRSVVGDQRGASARGIHTYGSGFYGWGSGIGIDLNFDGSKMAPTNWPARFRAALKVFVKSNGLRLPPWRLDDFYETYADQLTQMGTPQLYFMEQEQLQFYPIPSAANGVVTLKYIEYPAELTSSSLEADIWLPLRFHRGVLVNGAAAKLAAMEDDLELATYFENQMEKAYMQMEADLWRWQYDQPDYIHVVDDDNWSLA